MNGKFEHLAMWTWPESVLGEDPRVMARRLAEAGVDIVVPYACPRRGREALPGNTYLDRLAGIVSEAHRAGLKVHFCFDEMNAWKGMPVYDRQQKWESGADAGVLCPADPAVVDYILARLAWTLEEFACDGINLEDSYVFKRNSIYDPANEAGVKFRVFPVCYCDYCRKHAPIGKPEWADWKREKMTALVAAQAQLIGRLKPGMPFSVAARMPYRRAFYAPHRERVPYYDDWQFCESRDAYCADWAEWLRRGHIDFACPMSYFYSRELVELETLESRSLFPGGKDILMGLGLGEITVECRQAAKEAGGAPARGGSASRRNDARNIGLLLADQDRLGQRSVIFYAYQYLDDEHLPVMAGFSAAKNQP